MPIIVAGKLIVKTGLRDDFINASLEAISIARKHKSCDDFSVSSDPLDLNRVNIFEKWASRSALDEFRQGSSENQSFSMVESFDIGEYEI